MNEPMYKTLDLPNGKSVEMFSLDGGVSWLTRYGMALPVGRWQEVDPVVALRARPVNQYQLVGRGRNKKLRRKAEEPHTRTAMHMAAIAHAIHSVHYGEGWPVIEGLPSYERPNDLTLLSLEECAVDVLKRVRRRSIFE